MLDPVILLLLFVTVAGRYAKHRRADIPSIRVSPAGASHVYDPILRGAVGEYLYGIFRKDHKPVA